eukprot:1157907-Pelagomonas_calceolata.AAC.1
MEGHHPCCPFQAENLQTSRHATPEVKMRWISFCRASNQTLRGRSTPLRSEDHSCTMLKAITLLHDDPYVLSLVVDLGAHPMPAIEHRDISMEMSALELNASVK